MGQKIHPKGLRIGIINDWDSVWCSRKDYQRLLHEDLKIRDFVKEKMHHAGIARVLIERTSNRTMVNIFSSRPGIIIGKKGAGIDFLKTQLQRFTQQKLSVNIKEVRKAELDAQLVAENIAMQLERRVSFRRAMKKSMGTTLKLGAKGIKVKCSGRLGGAEMARKEKYHEGPVPLHTLRADIDYGYAVAKTTYGTIGVKVWIFKGEVLDRQSRSKDKEKEAPTHTAA